MPEVIRRRIDRTSHIGYFPAARFGLFGAEYIEAAEAGVTVGCEIKYRVGAKRREHLVAGGIDPFAKIFERTRTLAQVDTPNIATAMAAGHIRCEIEPVAVGRHRRVGVARYGVGCYLRISQGRSIWHRCAARCGFRLRYWS